MMADSQLLPSNLETRTSFTVPESRQWGITPESHTRQDALIASSMPTGWQHMDHAACVAILVCVCFLQVKHFRVKLFSLVCLHTNILKQIKKREKAIPYPSGLDLGLQKLCTPQILQNRCFATPVLKVYVVRLSAPCYQLIIIFFYTVSTEFETNTLIVEKADKVKLQIWEGACVCNAYT